jgi:hypothetical protein
MKVSDAMVDAAINQLKYGAGPALNDDEFLAMRLAIEAAIAAHVPLTKSQAAKDRWARTSPMERHQHMKAANKKRHPNIGY